MLITKKLTGCQNLRGGEHIQLGIDGPEFLFESQSVSPTIPYTPTTPAGVPATVIEPKYSQPQQQYISPSPQSNGLPWKVIGGVVGVIAVLFLLTREPSPETATNPPENPSTTTENPATPPPQNTPSAASGDISVETEDFEDFFEITGEMQRINDVEITTRSGRKVKVDVVAFPIQAKSSFSSESREFIARFYDPQGNEINEPSPLIYDPKPQTWSRGRESTAGFILPSDISTLRVIEITY